MTCLRFSSPLIVLLHFLSAIFDRAVGLLLQGQNFIQRTLSFKGTGGAEGPPDVIPQREELAVVVVVEEVVVGVVGAAVDQRLQQGWDAVVAIVYRHRPDVDKDEEAQVGDLLGTAKERGRKVTA